MKYQNPIFRAAKSSLIIAILSTSSYALNLDEWMNKALLNNSEVLQAKAQQEKAKGGAWEARSYALPKLTLGVSAVRTDDALQGFGMKVMQRRASFNDFGIGEFRLDPSSDQATQAKALAVQPTGLNQPKDTQDFGLSAQVEMPLFTGGLLYQGRKIAKAGIEATQHAYELTIQKTIFKILQNYAEIKGARATLQVASQSETTYTRLVSKIHSMEKEGLLSRVDLLSAQLKLNDAKLMKQEAQDKELEAMDRLKISSGHSLNQPL
jgi:outer membrane protein